MPLLLDPFSVQKLATPSAKFSCDVSRTDALYPLWGESQTSVTLLAIIGLFVVLLLFSSLMIATDLTKQELIDKYANEKSFFYFLPSGAEVHIRDQGNKDKPPVFLLHGSNASLHTWEPLVAQLKDDYRLISFDLPGHGLTGATPQEDYSNIAMANFTREVIELYDFKSVTLVGNSMGGAWRCAMR